MALVLKRTIVKDRALAVQTKYHDPSAVLSRGTRHLFLVPWRGRTMIGVNSLIWKEEPDRLRVTEKEVTDFLDEINEADPRLKLTLDDVGLVMAGLLPVERGDAEGGDVSFGKRPLVVDNAATDRVQCLVTAVANRYTVARGVAQRSVDLAYRKLGREPRPCRTETARVYGGDFGRFEDLLREVRSALPAGTDPVTVDRLAHDHGSAYGEVTRIIDERPEWGRPVAGDRRAAGRGGALGAQRDGGPAGRLRLRPARHRHAGRPRPRRDRGGRGTLGGTARLGSGPARRRGG